MRSETIWQPVLLLGAIALLIGLFLLPWIRFWDAQTADGELSKSIRSGALVKAVAIVPSGWWNELGLSFTLSATGIRVDFKRGDLQQLRQVARSQEALTGWSLWRTGVPLSTSLRLCLWLSLLVAVFAAALFGLYRITGGSGPVRTGLGLVSGAAILSLLPLLGNLADVDTLGFRDDLGIAIVCWLSGSRPGIGIYVALLGLLLIASGAAIGYLAESAAPLSLEEEIETLSSGTYG